MSERQEVPLTLEEHASRVATEQAVYALPTEGYVGLTVAEAEAKAASEGRTLVVADLSRGRPMLVWRRVRSPWTPKGAWPPPKRAERGYVPLRACAVCSARRARCCSAWFG
jgi:hypothetical protein